jgi:hypothetical protein
VNVTYATKDVSFGAVHVDMGFRIGRMKPGDTVEFHFLQGYSNSGARVPNTAYVLDRYWESLQKLVEMQKMTSVQIVNKGSYFIVSRNRGT